MSASCQRIYCGDHQEIDLIGIELLVLRGDYDREQLWLDFVQFIWLLPPRSAEPVRPTAADAEIIQRGRKWHAITGTAHKRLYHFKAGVEQYLLPFPDRLRLSGADARRLRSNRFPGFERLNGKIATFKFAKNDRDTLIQWCADHCRYHYSISDDIAIFSRASDAALAKLLVQTLPYTLVEQTGKR